MCNSGDLESVRTTKGQTGRPSSPSSMYYSGGRCLEDDEPDFVQSAEYLDS
jgi:hypothetical protein